MVYNKNEIFHIPRYEPYCFHVRSVACRIDLNIDMEPKYGVFLFDSIILIV